MNEKAFAHQQIQMHPERVVVELECIHEGKKVRHHYDYSKPFNVHLLCMSCHRKTYVSGGRTSDTSPELRIPPKHSQMPPFLEKYLWKNRLTCKKFADLCGISQPTLRILGKLPVSKQIAEKVSGIVRCSVKSLINPRKRGKPCHI